MRRVHADPRSSAVRAISVDPVKVIIDTEACAGHGRCYSLSPDVFDPDDEGHSAARVKVVDGALLLSAEAAVSNCPEHAITLVEE
jgi:ferredoxin